MMIRKKNILRILFALFILANINVYSAYNPCIDRPEFLRPKFLRSEFNRPDFEKAKYDKPVLEKPVAVKDDFIRPNFIKPSFILPKFQDCVAMKEKKIPLEKTLIKGQQTSFVSATNQTEKFVGNNSKEVNKISEPNPNSFFFYKPPDVKSENKEEDCCGVVEEKQIKNDESSQVVTSRINELR